MQTTDKPKSNSKYQLETIVGRSVFANYEDTMNGTLNLKTGTTKVFESTCGWFPECCSIEYIRDIKIDETNKEEVIMELTKNLRQYGKKVIYMEVPENMHEDFLRHGWTTIDKLDNFPYYIISLEPEIVETYRDNL